MRRNKRKMSLRSFLSSSWPPLPSFETICPLARIHSAVRLKFDKFSHWCARGARTSAKCKAFHVPDEDNDDDNEKRERKTMPKSTMSKENCCAKNNSTYAHGRGIVCERCDRSACLTLSMRELIFGSVATETHTFRVGFACLRLQAIGWTITRLYSYRIDKSTTCARPAPYIICMYGWMNCAMRKFIRINLLDWREEHDTETWNRYTLRLLVCAHSTQLIS